MLCAVIITALPVEYLAVRKHLKNLQEVVHTNGTVYERGDFAAEYQNWEIGIVEVGAGNAGAAVEVERSIACFQPDVILFVGIAGGIKDVELGDVVASTKIYGYESGKSEQDFKPRPEIGLSAYSLEQRARAEARKDNWLKRLDDSSLTPRVFVAPIAAGDKVASFTKSEVFKFLRSTYEDAVAVEMEGFRFVEAARANHQISTMVIRGISDLIDKKNHVNQAEYQKLAANNASAFAFEVLAKLQLSDLSSDKRLESPKDTNTKRKIKVFISYSSKDESLLNEFEKHLGILARQGLIDIWHDRKIEAGSEWEKGIESNLDRADIILLLISADFMASDYFYGRELRRAMERHETQEARVIPVILRSTDWRASLVGNLSSLPTNSRPVTQWENRDEAFLSIIQGIRKVIAETSFKLKKLKELNILKIEIYNIKCFKHCVVNLTQQQEHGSWLMLLGDNAIGKSTLLKSLVLGLCNESDAAALIKIAESSGEFIKKGEKEGRIIIHLREKSQFKRKKYTITTTIYKVAEDAPEIVRQKTQPAENFPWADIFVCGYGAYRSKQADTSYEQYKAIDAVKSLFDHQTSLQNPELISLRYLRQNPQIHSILEEKLLNILMLDLQTHAIHFTTRGLEIDGPWGRMPLHNLSDGYRSTTIWVLDFIGWLLHAERLLGNPDIGGILIIDEIEQHLHPRWQRHIVQRLRQQFPKTQIIASTHTPLVAAGIADVDQSMLLKLERNEENEISLKVIDKEQVAGKRADQVLTSDAFGLYTTRNERSHDDVDRYTKLLGKKTRNNEEEAELQQLRPIVQSRLSNSESPVEQSIEKAVKAALHSTITNVSPEMVDIETKKQLQALFHPED